MMKANPRVLMALSRAFIQAVFLFDFVARHVGAEIILHVCVCVCPSLYRINAGYTSARMCVLMRTPSFPAI